MQLKTVKYHEDINIACGHITDFTKGKDYLGFKNDIQLKFAIERLFITIGEAANKLSKNYDIHLKSESSIVALRNVMVHDYNSLHDGLIWQIIETDLVDLKIEIEELIKKYEQEL